MEALQTDFRCQQRGCKCANSPNDASAKSDDSDCQCAYPECGEKAVKF